MVRVSGQGTECVEMERKKTALAQVMEMKDFLSLCDEQNKMLLLFALC